MLEIDLVSYEDLPLEKQECVPNNGCGKEDAEYLRIKYYGKEIAYESNAMEPEDVRFTRDLSWIKDLLIEVYSLGRKDGEQDARKQEK